MLSGWTWGITRPDLLALAPPEPAQPAPNPIQIGWSLLQLASHFVAHDP